LLWHIGNGADLWFSSYEQFVSISKEISTLENDMLELKESLSEWKSMPSLLQVDDSAASGM
jgi:exocyst complex component 8